MAYDPIQLDERLILRPPRIEDVQAIRAIVEKDSEYLANYLPWAKVVPSLGEQTRYIQSHIDRGSKITRTKGHGSGHQSEWYAIQLEGEFVGGIELMIPNEAENTRNARNKGELGYWLASHVQGRGIMTRAAIALTSRGFGELSLDVVWIYAELHNTPSRNVAERAGYTLRGEFSRKLRMRNDPEIMAGYSANSADWELPD